VPLPRVKVATRAAPQERAGGATNCSSAQPSDCIQAPFSSHPRPKHTSKYSATADSLRTASTPGKGLVPLREIEPSGTKHAFRVCQYTGLNDVYLLTRKHRRQGILHRESTCVRPTNAGPPHNFRNHARAFTKLRQLASIFDRYVSLLRMPSSRKSIEHCFLQKPSSTSTIFITREVGFLHILSDSV
jgi:hypothetical protein